MAGARELKKPAGKKNGPLIAVGIALAVIIVAYLALCAWVGGSAKIMPNVTIAGLDVSGMSRDEAQDALDRALEEKGGQAVVTLEYEDWSGSISAAELNGFGENSVNSALEVGRGSFITQGFRYIQRLLGGTTDVELDLSLWAKEQPAVEELIAQAQVAAGDLDANDFSYRIENDTLLMTKGETIHVVYDNQVKNDLYQAMQTQAIPAAFRGEKSEVAVALAVTDFSPERPENFFVFKSEICTEAKNAEVDPETYEIIPHTVGIDFDAEALMDAYQQAEEGETFSVPLTIIMPEETTESLESKLFADLLGEGTSQVGGTANRKFNVKLSAEACNNVILMPGEVFSYNNTTGSRSEDKGYLPAPVYSGGQSVDETGGGICQTSSTIYYAVLHTTLEIVERSAHMYATGYVPDGMDATVYFGALDFQFKNSTNYPIKIVTESYDRNGVRYLNVKIYGTNEDGRYAVPERVQYDWEEPTVKYVADETIPQGTTKEDAKQNPYTGRKAQTYRYVYEKDGTLVEKQDMGVSKYKMRPKTLYYNPLDGDPATWVNGVPPTPNVAPVQPDVPEPEPEVPAQPEQETVGGTVFPGGPIITEDPNADLKPGELPEGF